MSPPVPQSETSATWQEAFARSVQEQRNRIHKLVDEQRQRFAQLDEQLLQRAEEAAEHFAAATVLPTTDQTVSLRQETLLDEVLRHIRGLEAEFNQHGGQAIDHAAQTAQAKEWEEKKFELAQRELKIAEREQETEMQRKYLARQMWARKAELLSEIERARAEIQAQGVGVDKELQLRYTEEQSRTQQLQQDLRRLEQEHANARSMISDLRQDLEQARSQQREQNDFRKAADEERKKIQAELEKQRSAVTVANREVIRLGEELFQAQKQAERRTHDSQSLSDSTTQPLANAKFLAQIEELTAERERLQAEQQQLREQIVSLQTLEDELRTARCERTELTRKLNDLEDQLERQAAAAPAGKNSEELERRLEMAMADIRELRARNQDLAARVSQGSSAAASAIESGSDWESQKRKLLAALEQDFDDSIPHERTNKLTVEGAIRITDQIVADRDREIEELRSLLAHQSDNIGNVAVGAAAIAEMLNQDELIVSERENLKQMQESLQNQLREAEVQISLERAKVARERSELEERLRAFEKEKNKLGIVETASPDKAKGASRGQWLQRLGLKDGK